MGALSIILLVVFVISAILLLIIVLIQDEQGEGLGGIFGGGGMSGQIGNRKGNLLTRVTSILGVIFLLTSLALAFINRSPNLDDIDSAARQAEREGAVQDWWEVPEEDALDTNEDTSGDSPLPPEDSNVEVEGSTEDGSNTEESEENSGS